jgi:hypothetical protein
MMGQAFFIQFENPNFSFLVSLGFALLFILLVFLGKKKLNTDESE